MYGFMHPVKYSNNFSQLTSVYKQYQESDKLIISFPVKPYIKGKYWMIIIDLVILLSSEKNSKGIVVPLITED